MRLRPSGHRTAGRRVAALGVLVALASVLTGCHHSTTAAQSQATGPATMTVSLLGSHYPGLVNGVIAGVPGSVVNLGYPYTGAFAWTQGGRPIPAASFADFSNATPANLRAVIAVERIRGPILTVCGLQDQVWVSCSYQRAMTDRLASHHFRYLVTALQYSDAGHDVGSMDGIGSATPVAFTLGGSWAGNQTALADAHAKLLKFLAAQ